MTKQLLNWAMLITLIVAGYLPSNAQITLFPAANTSSQSIKVAQSDDNTFLVHLYGIDKKKLYDISVYSQNTVDEVMFKIDQSVYKYSRVGEKDTLQVEDRYFQSIKSVVHNHLYIPLWVKYNTENPFEDKVVTLVVSNRKDKVDFRSFTIGKRSLPADLVAGAIKAEAVTTSPFSSGVAIFNSSIYEKELDDEILGTYADFVSFEGDPAYDPKANTSFKIDGQNVSNFWGISKSYNSIRNIQKDQIRNLEIQQTGLSPGTYKTKISLKALNNKNTDGAEMELVINVRHHVAYPIVVIILAVAFTFGVNVLLKNQRERTEIKRRLNNMDKDWLKDDHSVAAIKVLATISQVNKLSNRWLIASNDIITKKLDEADKLIEFLRKLRELREHVERQTNELMRVRARKRLRKITNYLGEYELTEVREKEVSTRITSFAAWFGPFSEFEKAYAADLKNDIDKLIARMNTTKFAPANQVFIGLLINHMTDKASLDGTKQAAAGKVLDQPPYEREKSYAALKIFWDQIKNPNLGNLITAYQANYDLQDLFETVDLDEYNQVKQNEANIIFKTPKNEVEAFNAVIFQLGFSKGDLGDRFFFKYAMRYKWKITVTPLSSKKKPIVLEPETREPKVVQFIPYPATFKVEVTGFYKTNVVDIQPANFESISPIVFRLDKSLERSLVIATGASTLIAIITGILTYYTGDPTFGSLKDYISLFLIGAGIDQTKNFLSRTNTYAGKG